MALLDYTSYDEVRAVLGVSSTELPDRTLAQPLYDTHAELALEDIAPTLPTVYADIVALPSGTATAVQLRLQTLVQLFVPYAVAAKLLTSLPLFAVQSLTDGRAGFDRQDNGNIFEGVGEDVKAALADIVARLKASFLLVTGLTPTEATVTMPTLTVASLRGLDPVTDT